MASCSHGSTAPDAVIISLPICQGGKARHKCAICAYEEGVSAGRGKIFAGPMDQCGKQHASAPLAMVQALPISQAKPYRHRCSYLAFQLGRAAGMQAAELTEADEADERERIRVLRDSGLTETQKEQLVLARRGQGLFRENVTKLLAACPVTGISDPRFLIASHIKPWRVSSNEERLDGYNGLLLSPHIDHLFDKGWITFDLSGAVLWSPHLSTEIREAWAIGGPIQCGKFESQYGPYLDHHRKHVFRS